MRILCEISPWIDRTVERGRTAGQIIKVREVLAADIGSWCLATQIRDETGPLINCRYMGNMSQLMKTLAEIHKDRFVEIANTIIGALVIASGQEKKLTSDRNPFEHPGPFGTWIDNNYGTSFMREQPPTVKQRLLKDVPEVNAYT